ncbi:hypothetical protein DYQ86_16000 [Acidobacteria bacterium AB60]|nr:hypothetical protein DYQ86_16000 [Acidobacteria bacterium AB60]
MIRQIERANEQLEALRTMLKAFAAGFWVALPGKVQSYNAAKGIVNVLPTIEMQVSLADGSTVLKQMPVIVDCPVIYMGGGPFVATFPIQVGDEALVIFADRCIDAWWQSGQVRPQAELRMHSLSDGFALIGPRSLANAIPNVSTSTAQLRSLDGSTYVEIAGGSQVNVVAAGGIKLTGPVMVEGNLTVTGTAKGQGGTFSIDGAITATGDGQFAGHSVSNHVHPGVQPGAGDTGTPLG